MIEYCIKVIKKEGSNVHINSDSATKLWVIGGLAFVIFTILIYNIVKIDEVKKHE